MEAAKNTQIGYKVIKIHTTKFSCAEVEEDNIDLDFNSGDKFGLNISFNINIKQDESILQFDLKSTLVDNNTDENIVEHTGRTVFSIENIMFLYEKETDSYNFPDELLTQIYGLAYTHARALLSVELSPTIFKDKYFLPVIDPREMIPKTTETN